MNKAKLYAAYGKLPSPVKIGISIVTVLVLLVVLYLMYSAIKKAIDKMNAGKDIADVEDDIKELAKQGILPTISISQSKILSGRMQEAFSGCGTDDAAVALSLDQVQNDADILRLIKSYDVRSYAGCWAVGEFSDVLSTLPVAIDKELDLVQKGLQNLNFSKKGMKYRL